MKIRRITRRRSLEMLALGSAALLSSCCLFVRKPKQLCLDTPDLEDPEGPLAIDVHAHVFNATDLQISEFVSRVALRDTGPLGELGRLFGSLLQGLGWSTAPSVHEELAILDQLAARDCSGIDGLDKIAEWTDKQYRKTREDFWTFAEERKPQITNALPAATGAQLASLNNELTGLNNALALPDSYEDFRRMVDASSEGIGPQEVGIRSALDFLIEQFQYRVSSVARYFEDYNSGSEIKIDLICPSLVDYDWWLADGDPTHSSLEQQVELSQQLAIHSGGRVHAFVPFDPFREVVFRSSGEGWSSLELVRQSVTSEGAIGVKLYPPMGFAAFGNSSLDVWHDKDWLPEPAHSNGFGEKLDAALADLYTWCKDQQVPILAHTNPSNSPHDDFLPLVGPDYWSKALDKFGGLRVNFGHFGGAGSDEFDMDAVEQFLRLMADPTRGTNAFADASYFARLLEDPDQVVDLLNMIFDSPDFGATARKRLIYGSDWKMLLLEKNASGYLQRFKGVIAKLSDDADGLVESFFGESAASFLGLHKGGENRNRLERFYVEHDMALPVWITKVDRAAGPV